MEKTVDFIRSHSLVTASHETSTLLSSEAVSEDASKGGRGMNRAQR